MCPHPDRQSVDYANEYLSNALSIGEQMLRSGAEVSRVEDSIRRICTAYGAERVDVFTITSSIVVTISGKDFGTVTQTRRISGLQFDFRRLERLNELSRLITQKLPTMDQVEAALERIRTTPSRSFPAQLAIWALVSASFTPFFGGSWRDAIASAIIGVLLKCADAGLKWLELNGFLAALR